MTGWQWCPKASGRCRKCGSLVIGMWRFWKKPALSTCDLCEPCVHVIIEDGESLQTSY
jgi:hypothetical protein